MSDVTVVDVFTFNGAGGNPCPVVMDADGMSAAEMRDVARRYGHESGFVLPADGEDHDFRFRFFVPNHEMEMCGHATVGALSLLARNGRLSGSTARISTLSGLVTGFVGEASGALPSVEITQPTGRLAVLASDETALVLKALGISPGALADRPLRNAATSRVKTLVPIRNAEQLNALATDMATVEAACTHIGSTGLYPYAVVDKGSYLFEARQFPRSSGYAEDAATGIAATALAFGLLADELVADDRPMRIFQGRSMGRLSEIRVRIDFAGLKAIGCRVGGAVSLSPEEFHPHPEFAA